MLSPDYCDMLAAFSDEKVEYLLVKSTRWLYVAVSERRRIDILTSLDGEELNEACEAREEIEFKGVSVVVIDKVHLEKNKEATGQTQDRVDLDGLRAKPLTDPVMGMIRYSGGHSARAFPLLQSYELFVDVPLRRMAPVLC